MSGVEANPPVSQESKSAKKKKAKSGATAKETTVQSNVETEAGKPTSETPTNGIDGSYESPYMKELYKCVGRTSIPFVTRKTADVRIGAFATSRRSL